MEGAKEVRIHGQTIPVRAKAHSLGGFSAHASQSELLEWFSCLAPKHPRVILTHGQERGREPLAALIENRFHIKPQRPLLGDVIEV